MKKIDSKNLIPKITIQTDSPKIKDEKKDLNEPQVPKKKKKFFSSPSKKITKKSK